MLKVSIEKGDATAVNNLSINTDVFVELNIFILEELYLQDILFSVVFFTLAGRGHYAALSQTRNRPGYTARMTTPYMNTSNKCIELFYWISDDDTTGDIYTDVAVVMIGEELNETTIVQSIGWDYVDFQRLFAKLPDGIHRVAIEGRRDSRQKVSGISLDDITITNCSQFGECVHDTVHSIALCFVFFKNVLTN